MLRGWAGGVVYTCWGHDTYRDSEAQLVYGGSTGGSNWNHREGGGTIYSVYYLHWTQNSIKQSVVHRLMPLSLEWNM